MASTTPTQSPALDQVRAFIHSRMTDEEGDDLAKLDGPRQVEILRAYADHTIGSPWLMRHGLGALRFIMGIVTLAEVARAWWLIDVIASHQGAIGAKHRDRAGFQAWTVAALGSNAWTVTAWSDTPGESYSTILASQVIEYSDLAAAWNFAGDCTTGSDGPLTVWCEGGNLFLPAER